jgi:hypothetical protein
MTKPNLIWAIVFLSGLLLLGGCGSGKSSDATTKSRPKSDPPLYHQKEYDVETTWDQDASDRKAGSYLESVWHDPASFSSKLIVDSRPAEGAPPPLMAAELSRLQANWLPEYRERSLKKVKLGHRSATRWAFYAAGEDRFEYFFEECGTSIVLRGSTVPVAFKPFSEYYGLVASTIKVVCNE